MHVTSKCITDEQMCQRRSRLLGIEVVHSLVQQRQSESMGMRCRVLSASMDPRSAASTGSSPARLTCPRTAKDYWPFVECVESNYGAKIEDSLDGCAKDNGFKLKDLEACASGDTNSC